MKISGRTVATWLMVITIPWCMVSAVVGYAMIDRSGIIGNRVDESANLRSGVLLAQAAVAGAANQVMAGQEIPYEDGAILYLGQKWPIGPDAQAYLEALRAIASNNEMAYAHWRDALMLAGFAKAEGNQIGTMALQNLASYLSVETNAPLRSRYQDLLGVATVVVLRGERAAAAMDMKHVKAESACYYAPMLPPCIVATVQRNYDRQIWQVRARDSYIRSEPAKAAHVVPTMEVVKPPLLHDNI